LRYKFRKSVNSKGFTLVELIISIGIIAIISSSILQLFITAGNLNRKAFDIDKCVMLSESIIEQFKSGNTPIDLKNTDIMKTAFYSEENKNLKLILYFDSEWNEISKATELRETDALRTASYILKAVVKPTSDRGIFNIRITVIKNKYRYLEKNTKKNFYTITAVKYFTAVGGD
jgi:prepilin-type N-terminal cleavage/methylation domain-containing protein